MKKLCLITVLCLAITGFARAETRLSYVDLVKRLTDMEALAVLPEPGEMCAQWSSYDRASRYDDATGKYVEWSANRDGNGIVRTEGDTAVIAEMDGPGCIWRIWSAHAGAGHIKIYLDGVSEPAVDLPFSGYFNHENAPFTYPSLVHMTARGLNCYVPIPYQRSCKIVAEKDWGLYYHFTYQTFPKGTIVPTFKREPGPEELAALHAADTFLNGNLGSDPAGKREQAVTTVKNAVVPPGTSYKVARLRGERAITAIKVNMSATASEDISTALRELVLQITWDDEKSPSVWVPLGDFFGTAPGINKYRSLPLGMTDDGFYSYWYMPFAKSAVVELVNDGASERSAEFTIVHAPLSRDIEELGRFHAKWHRDAFLPVEPERKIDWTILTTEGRGRYCGVALNVWNPRGGWWGEGDEKFFVDGEKFPSTFGTGSEDYFGYAWGNAELFENAYHNQTISMGNRGHVSVNRWHITDNVPFQESFEGAIEKYFPNDNPTQYDAAVYWYLAPGGKDPYGPVPANDRVDYYAQPKVFKAPGALEGEELKVIEATAGVARFQPMFRFGKGWSNDGHLAWRGGKPGDKLVLAIPVQDAGTYDLKIQLTKAASFGIVQLYLDDETLGEPIDLYVEGIAPSGELSFGTHKLSKGEHKLTIEMVGTNATVKNPFVFGLDYVKLEKVNNPHR